MTPTQSLECAVPMEAHKCCDIRLHNPLNVTLITESN